MSVITDVTLVVHYESETGQLAERLCEFGDAWNGIRKMPPSPVDTSAANGSKVYTDDLYVGAYNHLDAVGLVDRAREIAASGKPWEEWTLVVAHEHTGVVVVQKKGEER